MYPNASSRDETRPPERQKSSTACRAQHFTFINIDQPKRTLGHTTLSKIQSHVGQHRTSKWNDRFLMSVRKGEQTTRRTQRCDSTSSTECDNSMSSGSQSAMIRWRMPMSPMHFDRSVNRGRGDPFAVFPKDVSPQVMHRLIDHAMSNFWPRLFPISRQDNQKALLTLFYQDMQARSLEFYSYMSLVALHYEFVNGPGPHSKGHLRYAILFAYRATKLLQDAVNSTRDPAEDYALLTAIMSLVSGATMTSIHDLGGERRRFRNPLSELQCLNFFAQLELVEPHWQAATALIQIKGGTSVVSTERPGMLLGVYMTDILQATIRLTRPSLIHIYDEQPLTPWPNFRANIGQPLLDLIPGLRDLPSEIIDCQLLRSALCAAVEMTGAIEYWTKVQRPTDLIPELCLARNRAQYMALLLHGSEIYDKTCLTIETTSRAIHDLLHWTLLIYNNIVILPTPTSVALDRTLAGILFGRMTKVMQQIPSFATMFPGFTLWVTAIGGISDSADVHRHCFREWFRQAALPANAVGSSKANMKETLSSFVWCERILDNEWDRFWQEALIESSSQ